MPPTREELEKLFKETKQRIEETRDCERVETDPREKARLKKQKKELQYLQLWNWSLYDRLDD